MKNILLTFLLLIGLCVSAQDTIVSVNFKGQNKTKESALKKLISIKKGQVLDSLTIEKDLRLLKRQPLCTHADYLVTKKENGYDVTFRLQENYTIIPSFDFYSTNNGELAYLLGVYDFNFLGNNITLGGVFQRDIYNSYNINFKAPFLFSRHCGIALSHSNLTTQEPVFLSNGSADYKYNNTSFESLFLVQFNIKHRIEIGGNFFTEDYEYITGATEEGIPQDFRVKKILYKLIYEFDNLTYYFQYISGFKSTLNVQRVISTEDVLPDFLIFFNDFRYFKRVGKKGNWANRMRIGFASNIDSPFSPFAVDNNINLRGVGNVIDRGSGVISLNTEYRHTIWDKKNYTVQTNTFIDAGSWRNPGGSFSDFTNNDNIRIYPGIGLRFSHKRIFNAIFRVDYGYGITKGETQGFVFGIGQYF